jgi:hypothetical protein
MVHEMSDSGCGGITPSDDQSASITIQPPQMCQIKVNCRAKTYLGFLCNGSELFSSASMSQLVMSGTSGIF